MIPNNSAATASTAPVKNDAPKFHTIIVTDHELRIMTQCVSSGIKDIVKHKQQLSEMVTNKEDPSHVFEYFCKRHKILEDINKKLFEKL